MIVVLIILALSFRIPIKRAIEFDKYNLSSKEIVGQVNLNVTGSDWEIYTDKNVETLNKIIRNQDVDANDRIYYATICKNDPLVQVSEILFDVYGDELSMDNTFILKYERIIDDYTGNDFQYLLELNSWEIVYPVKRLWLIDWCFTDKGLTIYDYLLPKHYEKLSSWISSDLK